MSNETPNSVFDESVKRSGDVAAPEAVPTAQDSAQPLTGEVILEDAPTTMLDELSFDARQKITLRCGKSSITLHANGKIVLKGEYILSDAEGVNRIAGGHIELN